MSRIINLETSETILKIIRNTHTQIVNINEIVLCNDIVTISETNNIKRFKFKWP